MAQGVAVPAGSVGGRQIAVGPHVFRQEATQRFREWNANRLRGADVLQDDAQSGVG